jgi:3-oxoacyl-[acyl-carrier-protein] synthase-1
MEQDSICIISLGAQTAVGLNAISTAAAVRAGISGFNEHPFMINLQGEPYTLAMVPYVDPYTSYRQRMTLMVEQAVQETFVGLAYQGVHQAIPAIIGLPEVRPGLPRDLPFLIEEIVRELNIGHISINSVHTLLNGHSAGLMALERARQILSVGNAEFCLVGGVDSYIEPETLEWIEDNDQLHQPVNAWGFIPGEAAGFCLICSKDTAKRYKLMVGAELLAIATAKEQNRIKTETICLGQGLTQAVKEATKYLPQESKINYTICDQNGEAYRADEFGFMLTRLSEMFEDPLEYLTPADCWGDVGAASGPLFINQLCAASQRGYAKGPCTLLWTSSEGGERTAAIFKT